MEKYVNNIIRGFKKIFNKKYFAIVSVFIGIITVLGFSYGYLASESGWQLAAQLRISKLFYSFTINGNTTDEISVPANSGTTYYNVEITSLNDISTRYALTYNVSGTATVEISSLSVNNGSGIIGKYGTQTNDTKTRTVRIAVTNNSADAATIKLSVAGGYSWNSESQVALKTGYSLVSGLYKENNSIYGMSLADEVSMLLSCTPSASSPCLYTENANNYLTYGGYTWRIVGTYMINSEKVVKLILDSNYSTKVNYSSASSKLSAFYGSMSDTSLVRTASPFSCTAPDSNSITCSGSANYGHLSGAELTKIGNTASYLYTKPDEDYWLMQEGSNYYTGSNRGLVTSSSSATAFVRPSIYLKANVLNTNTSEGAGTSSNPYTIAQGVQIIVNGIENTSFSSIVSGYLAAGQSYTLGTAVHNSSNYELGGWALISGTGASLTNNVLTMGTGVTTITAIWNVTYEFTGAYDSYTAQAPGYYFIETWGAQGGIGYYLTSPTPGKGAYSSGYLYLSKGEKIYIYVGGKGGDATSATSIATAGYNGGGAGNKSSDGDDASGAGGGATDIRYFGNTPPTASDLEWNSTLGLNSRIMVAAGGGGSHSSHPTEVVSYRDGMDGGTLAVNGILSTWTSTWVPIVNQTSGNAFGIGATGLNVAHAGSGGGGGYYGGVNNSNVTYSGRASGGSSFMSGYAGSNAITSASDRTHTHNTLHYSGKYFLDGTMKSGVREGNGQATIKYVGLLSRTNTKLNGVRYIKDCVNKNVVNEYSQWVEIQAIKNGLNIAKNKTITGDTTDSVIVDGVITSTSYSGGGTGNRCVTVDLGSAQDLDEIAIWHYYDDGRVYYDNITSVSSDNSAWTEIINEGMVETPNGKRVSAYSETLNGYIQDGLLVWYDGISNTGTTRSTSTTTWKNLASSSYNGTIANGTWGDNYLTFNGTSTWVKVAVINPTRVTVEGVFKSTATTGSTQYVAANVEYGGYGLALLNGRQFRSLIYGNSLGEYSYATSTITASTSTIYNASTSFDGTNQKIHVFGEEVATTPLTDTIKSPSGNTPLAVGVNPNGTSTDGSWFKGQIYSIRLYNRALTDDEIYHNYLVDKERFGVQ